MSLTLPPTPATPAPRCHSYALRPKRKRDSAHTSSGSTSDTVTSTPTLPSKASFDPQTTSNPSTSPTTPSHPGFGTFTPGYAEQAPFGGSHGGAVTAGGLVGINGPGGGGGGQGGLKGDVWFTTPAISSPPSPSTIGSTTDSQAGGEYPPPSENENGDFYGRARSASQPQVPNFRRQNLSLNISALPAALQNVQYQSPSSIASSSAPFTDSFSNYPFDITQDYFQFAEASLPSASDGIAEPLPQTIAPNAYRLPASQPASPIRGLNPSQPYFVIPGRQRGATFSGGFQPYQFGGPLIPAAPIQSVVATGPHPPQPPTQASAIPAHLTFTNIQSPVHSASASPVIGAQATSNPGLGEPANINGTVGFDGDSVMEDLSTPMPLAVAQAQPSSSTSALGAYDMSGDMHDKLSLLDRIVTSAQVARTALLRGQDMEVSANLGQISSHLEIAHELGVGPAATPREPTTTPSSQAVSPVAYQASPTISTLHTTIAPQHLQSPIQAVNASVANSMQSAQALLPSLPVEPHQPSPVMVQTTGTQSITPTLPSGEFMSTAGGSGASSLPQAPPLVHSHSFPNGHQLPSQLHGLAAPSTPVVPSPSFTASLGIAHAPLISSPLASMPVSRPQSPLRPYPIPEESWADLGEGMSRPPSEATRRPSGPLPDGRADGRPVINRTRSTSVHKVWSHPQMTASVPPSAWHSRHPSPEADDEDDADSEEEGPRRVKRRRSSGGNEQQDAAAGNAVVLSDDIRQQLDEIFDLFMQRVCSDLDVVDNKGEKLHQVLMPKKMARLDESTDYRPFKFRIQAFTNAFHDELIKRGISEEILSIKKVKTYLWRQDLISRFNSDGKKAKSKGNHIWNVDAKKLPGGGWVFRPFKRRIIGQPNSFAVVGQEFLWDPRVWDPQAASETLRPVFSSPPGSLPPWLKWEEGNRLVGIPDQPSQPFDIKVHVDFVDGGGSPATIDAEYTIQVVPAMLSMQDPAAAAAAGLYGSAYAPAWAAATAAAVAQAGEYEDGIGMPPQQMLAYAIPPNMAPGLPIPPPAGAPQLMMAPQAIPPPQALAPHPAHAGHGGMPIPSPAQQQQQQHQQQQQQHNGLAYSTYPAQ